jgi:methylated-DNA-[protein]-cysteine S-methyltransferase
MPFESLYASPIGPLTVVTGADGRLEELWLSAKPGVGEVTHPTAAEVIEQLGQYFEGKRRSFDVELALNGSDFQRAVWQALLEIPYGETRSYGDVARAVGDPSASRAVGMANNANPIAIVVPCHRVIGADGRLVGYGGGLEKKRLLLQLEGSLPPSLFD